VIFDATVAGRTLRVEVHGRAGRYVVSVDGRHLEVGWQETGRDFVRLHVDGGSYELGLEKRPDGYRVVLPGDTLTVELQDAARGGATAARRRAAGPSRISAPMPGKIVRVLAQAGQAVEAGQGLVVMEAMKMENEIHAPRAGRVKDVGVRQGQAVESGALLFVLE
jgi:biotin carboxyl carrier protein